MRFGAGLQHIIREDLNKVTGKRHLIVNEPNIKEV
jgi:hypothetical protein